MTVPISVSLRSHNMADLAYPDIQAYLKVCDLVLVPMASTEQHGPHLPLSTDTVTAFQVASRVAAINNMLHTPAIWTGYSPQHMAGPGRRARHDHGSRVDAAGAHVRRRAQPHPSRLQQDRLHQRPRIEHQGR